jgi:hypothetical protein
LYGYSNDESEAKQSINVVVEEYVIIYTQQKNDRKKFKEIRLENKQKFANI